MIVANNFAPGNAGPWFWTDVLVPIVLTFARSGFGGNMSGLHDEFTMVDRCKFMPSMGRQLAQNVAAEEAKVSTAQVPADLQAVLDKPLYKNAVWGLRVVDGDTARSSMISTPTGNY